jgi:hypothetical protein
LRATLTLPGNVVVERERAENATSIWLDPGAVAKLKAIRGPGESYSDVMSRVARGRKRGREWPQGRSRIRYHPIKCVY